MIGDSLAEEPNSPETEENLESASPQSSLEALKNPETEENLESASSQSSLETLKSSETEENLESASPPLSLETIKSPETEENLEFTSPALSLEAANSAQTQATTELPSLRSVEEEIVTLLASENLQSTSQSVNADTSNDSAILESSPSAPPLVMDEPEILPIQEKEDESPSPVLVVEEVSSPSAQENAESISPPEPDSSVTSEPIPSPVAPTISAADAAVTSEPSPVIPEIAISNSRKRIFITGASGCVGHYLVETLIQETDHELFLLVRDPAKLRFDCNARPGINVIKGDVRNIFRYSKLLKTVNYVIMAATAWGGLQQQVLDINIYKNLQLLNLLDPKVCEHIIYFSTASVLDRHNQILKEATELGTEYIRSKSDFLRQVSRLPIYKRMTILYPTLVVGGDDKHPYSHLSSGLPGVTKWIKLIRFFKADGSFHFIHAQDIARVVKYLVEHPPQEQQTRHFVLANPAMTVNQAVEEACAYLSQKISFQITLKPWLADLLIFLFKIEMSPWDRFCLNYRHFTYQNPVNPATFGLPVYCATLSDVMKMSGIPRGNEISSQSSQTNQYKLVLDDQPSESNQEN
ncbi:MAG TPA: NAD-dependent epimerase/dehydratase family protein [Leptolyngbyaceae cyanobacterium]